MSLALTTGQGNCCVVCRNITGTNQPIPTFGDENCFSRCGSLFTCGHEESHVEMRVRIAVEMAMNDEVYLYDTFLSEGATQEETSSLSHMRCFRISIPWELNCSLELYVHCTRLKLWTLYKTSNMRIWQVHALASAGPTWRPGSICVSGFYR